MIGTIFVCVVLPVLIVFIVFRAAMNSDNKRAEILIKAIEQNGDVDADSLARALEKPRKSPREILNLRLLRGCIFSLIGILLIAIGLAAFATGIKFVDEPVMVPMLFGGASMAIGISYLIVYFVTRGQVAGDGK